MLWLTRPSCDSADTQGALPAGELGAAEGHPGYHHSQSLAMASTPSIGGPQPDYLLQDHKQGYSRG